MQVLDGLRLLAGRNAATAGYDFPSPPVSDLGLGMESGNPSCESDLLREVKCGEGSAVQKAQLLFLAFGENPAAESKSGRAYI